MSRYVRMEGVIYCTVCGGEHEAFDPTDEEGQYAYLECGPEYWRTMYWRAHREDYEDRERLDRVYRLAEGARE